jgi:cell fate regulator YaaT (PSP1 superfamily)
MPTVVGIRFRPASKVYYFDPQDLTDLRMDEYVLVRTARGPEVGRVVIAATEVPDDQVVGDLKPVIRRAQAYDLTQMAWYGMREEEALTKCTEMVRDHDLPMKLIRAEYSYDGSRLVFFFTAEKRVDFRKLVRDLARAFKARIELRQVGVRDEAKMIGGMGRCGRILCCASWLTDFRPVSIRMAKQQDLPLSPIEISGVCGRLLCCLAYENEHYHQIKEKLPRARERIETAYGPGKVTKVNVLKQTVDVLLESEMTVELSLEELTQAPKPQRKARGRGRRRR